MQEGDAPDFAIRLGGPRVFRRCLEALVYGATVVVEYARSGRAGAGLLAVRVDLAVPDRVVVCGARAGSNRLGAEPGGLLLAARDTWSVVAVGAAFDQVVAARHR